MIGFEEAREAMMTALRRTAIQRKDLRAAAGHYLAYQVYAQHAHPLFDMSAVDGYALADLNGPWRVVGALQAGDVPPAPLSPGACMRIFTGAMVPVGTEAVVMQEYVTRSGDGVTHADVKLTRGSNIRRKGEQSAQGDLLLEAGELLGPATIGLLASAGVAQVGVHAKPRVNILRTGGEFNQGSVLEPGRIFSSNEVMLHAALLQAGIAGDVGIHTARDEEAELREALEAAMDCDVLITTGGVSVGEHDLVRKVLEGLDAEVIFHGVRQKPGKPMLFARRGDTVVFALPGNPRAVMVALWVYVLPFLRAMQGMVRPFGYKERLPISTGLKLKGERTEFRAATVRDGQVHLLADEGSHMLRSLIAADALALMPHDVLELGQGDAVELIYLPRP